MVSIFTLREWEGFKSGIVRKDQILKINGEPVATAEDVYQRVAEAGPGAELTYTVERVQIPSLQREVVEIKVRVTHFTLSDYLILFPALMLLGAALYATGLVVFYLKPNERASWALLFMGVVMGIADAMIGEHYTNHRLDVLTLVFFCVGPSFMVLSLYFPVELKRKWPLVALIFIITLPVLVLTARYSHAGFREYRIASILPVAQAHSLRLIALIVMFRSFYISRDPRVRQQAKVVIFGFLVAFTLIIGLNIASILFHYEVLVWSMAPWLLIPLTLGCAILKHNLFDVDVFIRRSVSYLLASGLAVAAFFGLITALGYALPQLTGQQSQVAAAASTLLMVMIFRPLRSRAERVIDRRFYRDKYEYTSTIRRASGVLISIIDLDQLLTRLLETVSDAMKIERGLILLGQGDPPAFRAQAASGYADPQGLKPLSPDHPLARRLADLARPAQINDIEELPEFGEGREAMLEKMKEWEIVLAIPVIYERKLIGILGLGPKKSGAWYSSEDIQLLPTLMHQTAVAIENARKVEELKKMVELESSYRELKKLDEMKDNFLSMVSHDLRTPMTSIKGYAAILREKRQQLASERQDRYLDIIIRESDRLTRLINDLLDIQRFEAGRMTLELKKLDLREIVEESVASFQGAALAKGVSLEKDALPGEMFVAGDRDRLSQVMANLLSNAIKFTPAKGSVKVSAGIHIEGEKRTVRVAVADTGPGIPREHQDKLFNKFQQVDQLVRSADQGSGLGLALVREIVEHLGGSVGLESEPGAGSRFYFILPLGKDDRA